MTRLSIGRWARMARGVATLAVVVALVGLLPRPVRAQLDPLLFLKAPPPNVILVVDNSLSMLEDGGGDFYDPNTYVVSDDPLPALLMGVNIVQATTYRRIYENLGYDNPITPAKKYTATTITPVPDTAPNYDTFWDVTRLEIVKKGIAQAVGENPDIGSRWSVVGLRQQAPAWRLPPNCDRPVKVTVNFLLFAASDDNPCDAGGGFNKYALYAPQVAVPNYSLTSGNGVLLPFGSTTSADVETLVTRPVNDPLGLIPASQDRQAFDDRPITFALEDALSEAATAISSETGSPNDCRNTVVVLITGGPDSGDAAYLAGHDPVSTAAGFAAVTAQGRRVPIYVAGVSPQSGVAELQSIASSSGGQYFDAATPADIARAINSAIQAAYAHPTDFDLGQPSEFQTVHPVVGTVDLTDASDATGAALPDTTVFDPGGQVIAQRRNVLVTAGFELNTAGEHGMEGVVRAFRVFAPEADASQPNGYRFESDGTALWPNVDGRPETAGRARLPADPNDRNIFTWVPGSEMTAFTQANAATLSPYLGGADAPTLIAHIRNLPLGPIIGSTPGMMDPPFVQPPPDPDYGSPGLPGTYAGDYENRRSVIWVGGNNGMIHAIDARTGFEVWAFIPHNLLPKLRTLMDGQSVGQFDYFVDSSPTLAEVKIDNVWRTVLVVGQGYGGTFYQAFDVTEAGMGGPPPDSDDYAGVLSSFTDPDHVPLMWSFPRYTEFDTTITAVHALADGFPGDEVRLFGDLAASATPAEKSVGFTWSAPVVAPLVDDHSVNAAIVGSGYFPPVEDLLPGRGPAAPRAGRSLYVIDMKTGSLVGGATSCGGSGSSGCVDVGDSLGNSRKNTLQADPSAAGANATATAVTKVYAGDSDGTFRRFELAPGGTITFSTMEATDQPIYMSSALALFSNTPYLFVGTGSDLLPTTTGGGSDVFRLYGLRDNAPGGGASVTFQRNLQSGGSVIERVSTSPVVSGGVAFFTTVVEDTSQPCADPTSRLYALTFLGGAAYDTDGSGSVTAGEDPVVSSVSGRATGPFATDQHLFFGTSGQGGSTVEMFGDPEMFNNGLGQAGVRLLSWRGTQ